ncbi:hypothetical protein AKJ41_00015 [candidate division MSBL1 archaeon SCGC-AAA259O05]|uniref:THUMP domain-containing protein n=1 Tax=candidate division MSBL1 archaeon SCGC-AAA259O05 TaxID=1698271 RepID=A0A133V5S9_9EURY|nr:hypothetical protein AKJ41_00015 [candidate division MSBL1 archaeon SCGC-AAA259O05]
MELLATTIRGLESIAIEEIEDLRGEKACFEHEGMVRLSGREEDVFKLNYLSKTLHRVLILLSSFKVRSLEDVYRRCKEIDFSCYLNSSQKFAVRAKRTGAHGFTSMDLESEIGQAIVDSFQEEGSRIEVDLENPDVYIRSELRGEEVWVAIDTTGGESLHKRGYRSYEHPAPLKPTIAHCLVRLSEWEEDETLLDPMCGSGTICIEAWHWKNEVPNWFRDDYAFWRLPFLDREKFRDLKEKYDSRARSRSLPVRGCDVSEKHVRGAKRNITSAGADIQISTSNATEVSLDANKIVTNPPYGIRIGSKRKVKNLYEDFASNLADYQWDRAVILTGRPDYMPKEGLEERIDFHYGNLPSSILIF